MKTPGMERVILVKLATLPGEIYAIPFFICFQRCADQ